jgi:hypothetical protein
MSAAKDSPRYAALDFVIRSVTTAVLALALVGAVIYQVTAGCEVDTVLVGFAGLVVGSYFTGHAATNGSLSRKEARQQQVIDDKRTGAL